MKNYNNFDVEAELKPLLDSFLFAANFIDRNDKIIAHKCLKELCNDEDVVYYANKQELLIKEVLNKILSPFVEKIFEYQGFEYRICHPKKKELGFEFAFIKEGIGYVVTYDENYLNVKELLKFTNTSKVLNVSTESLMERYIDNGFYKDNLSLRSFFEFFI